MSNHLKNVFSNPNLLLLFYLCFRKKLSPYIPNSSFFSKALTISSSFYANRQIDEWIISWLIKYTV